MSSFDESKHRRGLPGNRGQFAPKGADAPIGGLDVPAPGPLKVDLLPEPDPKGGFDTRVEAPTGSHYLRGGVPHREDGPAYEGRDGAEAWFRDGKLHRDPADGPALVEDNFEEYYQDGRLVAP